MTSPFYEITTDNEGDFGKAENDIAYAFHQKEMTQMAKIKIIEI